jgi:hypothetical protein
MLSLKTAAFAKAKGKPAVCALSVKLYNEKKNRPGKI